MKLKALLIACGLVGSLVGSMVLPGSSATAAPTRYEAEAAPATCAGSIDTNHSGYSGTGFCNGDNAVGASAQFTVTPEAAGTATLGVRFANGASARPANLIVNGSTVATVSLESTGSWSTWATKSLTVSLNAGSNTIRLDPTTAAGLPNVDYLDLEVESGPVRSEAEDAPATCDGSIDTNHSGYSGTGFCNGDNAVGAAAQFTVNASAAGTATVGVRFANGTTTSRPADLIVNGGRVTTTWFNGTGAWSTWATTATLTVSVNAGSNTIRFSPTTANGLPNIDYLDFEVGSGSSGPVIPGLHADPHIAYLNGRYYIYPTTDGNVGWTASSYKTFSSADLVDWTDHGVILDLRPHVSWADSSAWAPAIAAKNGKYYLYFSGGASSTSAKQIGVAVADSPTGPFRDALGRPLIRAGQFPGQTIDPMVFTDDNGQSYLYWGQGTANVVPLNSDMVSFDPTKVRSFRPTGYNEGAFVIKRNGVYYFMWSEGDTRSEDYRVAYATGSSPYGPWTKRGVILQKRLDLGIKGTGHHSVVRVPGTDTWYMAYHRFAIPGGDGYHREVKIDRMYFNSDGTIRPVVPTR